MYEENICLYDYIQKNQNNGNIRKPVYNDDIGEWFIDNKQIRVIDLPYNKVRKQLQANNIKPISSKNGSQFGEIYNRSTVDQIITNLGLW